MNTAVRSQVRRMPERGSHDLETIWDILSEGFVASVGFSVEGQPFIIPTLYGSDREMLYLHGSAASRMLRELETGVPACVSVTIVDGLVLARSAFHHSMNYRSVVAFGTAKKITDTEQMTRALRTISEQVVPGRWADVRGPSRKELKATTVLAFSIEEASAKLRHGPPSDDAADYELPVWAGVVPLQMTAGQAIADPAMRENISTPDYIASYSRRLRPVSLKLKSSRREQCSQ
jgi:nitroimidazol reductase NimA-like FMN-containing flavoprotein (pyridoxamine 5'-phosphate oxidase superfamily)